MLIISDDLIWNIGEFFIQFFYLKFSFLKDIQAVVDDDPFDPGTETGLPSKSIQPAEDVDKSFLEGVLRFCRVGQHAMTHIVHGVAIAVIEPVLGQPVAVEAGGNQR